MKKLDFKKNSKYQKRYLIFGNGFIAQHYAAHLLKKGTDVLVVFHTKKTYTLPSTIQAPAPANIASIQRLLRSFKPHYIILTQGISFIPDNERELDRSIKSNVMAPLIVIEATYLLAKSDKSFRMPEKILTFGSAAEYGYSDRRKWKEISQHTKPSSLYGLVKHWLFEVSQYYANLGVPCVHLRHFNAIGAGQDHRFVVSSFCRQVALMELGKQATILSFGDLSQRRDFVDIRDAVHAYDIAIKKASPGQVINVCSGVPHAVADILNILKRLTLVDFSTRVDTTLIAEKRTREKALIGIPEWLQEQGWKSSLSLEQSVEWVLEYWREKLRREKRV